MRLPPQALRLLSRGTLVLEHRETADGVGKIERDQAQDYARRKGWDLATAERWLAPILNYQPG